MAKKGIDLSGFNHFKSKVDRYSLQLQNLQNVLVRICQIGSNYAKGLYGGSENITLEWRIEGDIGVIVASGENIAYLEYGTGERGRGSYAGQLPTDPIAFYSNKYAQDVLLPNGWTYSYAKELGLTDVPWSGTEAKAQMWKTAQYLRTQVGCIIREVVGA